MMNDNDRANMMKRCKYVLDVCAQGVISDFLTDDGEGYAEDFASLLVLQDQRTLDGISRDSDAAKFFFELTPQQRYDIALGVAKKYF